MWRQQGCLRFITTLFNNGMKISLQPLLAPVSVIVESVTEKYVRNLRVIVELLVKDVVVPCYYCIVIGRKVIA